MTHTTTGQGNTPALTPAARKWLARAAANPGAYVHPTWGPYQQLIDRGFLIGPQDQARITMAGQEFVEGESR